MEKFFCVALQLVACLSLLVIVHEFGHFIIARLFKIRVEKFYLFFNPWFSLFKFKPKNSDTEYGIGWLPLGGYVKIAGMVDESLDSENMKKQAEPWEYRSKPAWQRLCVTIAGVVFNFMLAIVLYSAISYSWGEDKIPLKSLKDGFAFSETAKMSGFLDGDLFLEADGENLDFYDQNMFRSVVEAEKVTVLRDGKEVDIKVMDGLMDTLISRKDYFADCRFRFVFRQVIEGSRCQQAGFLDGDSVVAVNGADNVFYEDCVKAFSENKESSVSLTVMRSGQSVTLTVVPDENGKIGVYPFFYTEHCDYGLLESICKGAKRTVSTFTNYASDMKYTFTKAGVESMGGFGTMASLFPYPFSFYSFWSIAAFLSVILAFMNILPIPALDGGHVLFLLYEIIFRRKPSDGFLYKAQIAGMLLLMTLMIYVQINDVFRFLL